MILLDTNVISAIMRHEHEHAVVGWLDKQDVADLYIATPSIFEIQYGIAKMPAGRNRRGLEERFRDVLSNLFSGRIVDFCQAEAFAAGEVHAAHISTGRNVEVPDSQIAGVARHFGAAVATRNITDFTGTGLQLINPWNEAG
jgi:toxin FitB